MRFTFDIFTLDVDRRELRASGELRPLQPQVFDLLVYLIQHRERVVSKTELLESLWSDAVVTDASLQRAVSIARAALAEAREPTIETHARRGYRFVARLADETSAEAPSTHYVETDDGYHLAYRLLGKSGPDILVLPGWSLPMDAWHTHPAPARFLDALTALGRVILFDRRGVGLSDRVRMPASLDERGRDLETILTKVETKGAVVLAFSEGASLALHLASEQPSLVRALVLVGAFVRMNGWNAEHVEALRAYTKNAWGRGATLMAMFPDHADDPALKRWASDAERRGTSPGGALQLLEMNLGLDARSLLSRVRAPAVVLHHQGDGVIAVANGREVAAGLPNAECIEAPGTDHSFVIEDSALVLDAVARFCRQS